MTLAPGSKLGPYEIVAPLGAGGMGEVWRARDPRLGRDVAIKVLPAAFAGDPDRMARFDREARMLAALNHPHIAGIHGIEDVDGTRAIVQELVEGPTLAARLEAGALPVDEALTIAGQIAEALEAAHDRGIVHRDLKPGNVKLAPGGAVKVLDFGLARALDDESSGPMLSQSPTLSQRMTEAGMILGTAAYMSPEQARGRAADRRADIWSFGVLLFEMLTGQRMFDGETASETMASVMKDEIRLDRLPGAVPARVRTLLERCLTRDPRQRLQSIGEARIVLEAPELPAAETQRSSSPPRRGNRALVPAALLAVALLAGMLGAWIASRSRPAPVVRKYPIVLGEHAKGTADPMMSPDARWIAYAAQETLFLRDLQNLETRMLAPRHVVGFPPFWSPDSRHVVYWEGERLYRVPVGGGPAVPLALVSAVGGGSGGTWAEDGTIYAAFGNRGLFEMKPGARALVEVLKTDSTSSDFHEPLALPGGRVAFIRHRRTGQADRIAVWDGRGWHDVYSTEEGTVRRLCWSSSGHIVFEQTGSSSGIWALPFSLRTWKPTGEPFTVVPGAANPSVSSTGTLLYTAGQAGAVSIPSWWDSTRGIVPIPGGSVGTVQAASLSPDGQRVAYNSAERGILGLWVLDVRTGNRTRLTFGPESVFNPAWTPDGRSILYNVGPGGVYSIPASGGGSPVRITDGLYPSMSADGRLLSVTRISDSTAQDVYRVEVPGDTNGVPLIAGPMDQFRGEIRRDGRVIAYMSDESGRFEIYLSRLPSGEGRWQVSTQGGRRNRWSPDGRRLYYQNSDGGELWMCEISSGDEPVPGTPRLVVNLHKIGLQPWTGRSWDVAPDGRILLFVSPRTSIGAGDAILVENWAEEFRK